MMMVMVGRRGGVGSGRGRAGGLSGFDVICEGCTGGMLVRKKFPTQRRRFWVWY